MAAIDKIKAHFDAIGNRTINVPEWDLVIHATPVSISERKAIYSGIEESDTHTPLVRILIIKAKDEKGDSLFSKADEPFMLNRADPKVLFRVAGQILGNDAPEARELGNS